MHRLRPRATAAGHAQWGVCVEESTATQGGDAPFLASRPADLRHGDCGRHRASAEPALDASSCSRSASNNEGVGIVVVDGTVAGSSAADSALQKGDVIAFVGQPGGPFESVEV